MWSLRPQDSEWRFTYSALVKWTMKSLTRTLPQSNTAFIIRQINVFFKLSTQIKSFYTAETNPS